MEENKVNSFTFYLDYYNLIDTLSIKDKTILLLSIVDYVFKDVEPELTGHNQAIFNTLKAQLNLSKNNSKRRTKQEPKTNQNETEIKPKKEPNENKTSIFSFKFYILSFNKYFNNNLDLLNKVDEWLLYKYERKELYKERGLRALLTEIENNCIKYGPARVMILINECMARNWKGIIFEKLKNEKSKEKETIDEVFARMEREGKI